MATATPRRDGTGIDIWWGDAHQRHLRAPRLFRRGADVLALLKEKGYEVVGPWREARDGGVVANVRVVQKP